MADPGSQASDHLSDEELSDGSGFKFSPFGWQDRNGNEGAGWLNVSLGAGSEVIDRFWL